MLRQESVIKKKRGPKPTGQGKPIGLRLHRDLLEPLEEWVAAQPDPKPNLPEAIRMILRASLIGRGGEG